MVRKLGEFKNHRTSGHMVVMVKVAVTHLISASSPPGPVWVPQFWLSPGLLNTNFFVLYSVSPLQGT